MISLPSFSFKRKTDDKFLWKNIIDIDRNNWDSALKKAKSGKSILIATSLGGYNQGAVLESVLAVALTLRGIRVDILLCDEFLPACQLTKIQKITPVELTTEGQLRLCRACFKSGIELFGNLGLPIFRFSQFIKQDQIEYAHKLSLTLPINKIKTYRFLDYEVGEHAYAGCLRYFARGDIGKEEKGEKILRMYLKSAIITAVVSENLLDKNKYDVACFHHGIYVPQGIIGEVCRKKKVHVINWNPAYRKKCFIFSHNNTYHHTMIEEPTSSWEKITWSKKLEKITMNYLKSRWEGKNDWIWFNKEPQFDLKQILKEVNVDFSKLTIGMLTNVMWDAQLHYPSNAFNNMLDWVVKTINYFKKRPNLQLLIRIHPAEVTGLIPSQQPLLHEINRFFPKLPKNIFVISPESHISTYTIMQKCNAVIIYNTKTGIELSSFGIPIIVAGEAWIRGKGFSFDVSSEKEYYQLLDKLPFKEALTPLQIERAKKYAFHFFFRRMIPLPFVTNQKQFEFSLRLDSIRDLSINKYKGLDIICDGILEGTPFIYPAEKEN